MTRFPSTTSELPDEVNRGSAVSTGRSKIEDFRDHERLRLSDDVVAPDRPSPRFSKPRERMLIAAFAFASLSISKPHTGYECSRTHSGLSDSTPHEAHSLIVLAGSPSTKCVPSRLHLYSSSVVNVSHAAEAVFWLLPADSNIDFTFKSSTATSYQLVLGSVILREFLQEVVMLSPDSLVKLSYSQPLLLPVVRALLFP